MYRVEFLDEAAEHAGALPADGLIPLAELVTLLQVAPWSGEPVNKLYPGAPTRRVVFGKHGEGIVTYLILEDQRRVVVVSIVWIG